MQVVLERLDLAAAHLACGGGRPQVMGQLLRVLIVQGLAGDDVRRPAGQFVDGGASGRLRDEDAQIVGKILLRLRVPA